MTQFNFFEIVQKRNLPFLDGLNTIPEDSGVYLLFAEDGSFLYVGKATDLHERISQHSSPREKNLKIKQFATFVFWKVTASIQDAEQLEGAIFDEYVRATGEYPRANQNRPPRATTVSRKEMVRTKVRNLLNNTLKNQTKWSPSYY